MKTKIEAPASAATPTEASGTTTNHSTSPANSVYHDSRQKSSQRFIDLLGYGEDAARHAADLSAVSGLSERDIRAETEAARRAGVPVIAEKRGYYIALTESERAACVRSLRHRGQELIRTAAALERAKLPLDGGC